MKKLRLGVSCLEISCIGLGTWAMGGGGYRHSWGPQDDRESIATIHKALELGINWIDTAPIYGFGHAETLVGRALKGMREKPFVATKCGIVWDEKRRVWNRIKRESIREEVEASLKRLKLETIDLYQVHWPLPEEDIEEAWLFIQGLVKEGKIRCAGVSNFQVPHMQKIESVGKPASNQPPYSMIERAAEKEVLPYCDKNNIGVVVYSPLQKGILTGAFTRERIARLPMDDHRRKKPYFNDPELSLNLKLVEGLHAIAGKKNITLSQLAIAWTLKNSAVTSAIVGARRPGQIEENVKAADIILSAEDMLHVETLLDKRRRACTLSFDKERAG